MKLHHLIRVTMLAAGLTFISHTPAVFANVCGTDYQIFNPTTNGLDFVTVQSSETLAPCVINSGLFLNYAANSLAYSQTLNSNFPAGQKRKDRTLGMDLSLGTGITNRWDIGVNIPFVLSQTVQDDYYVSSFGSTGAAEIKANTKFHLLGDESQGLAAIFTVNKNLITDNPFAGRDAGFTYTYEVAADTLIAERWAVGANFGYRDRNPGTQIAGIPFAPMGDQWIYSAAASYLVSSLDTKVIAEVYGSKAAQKIAQDTDRNLNSLEGLLGVKYDASPGVALHVGGTHHLVSSLGGADWRVYVGINWAIGPLCDTDDEGPVMVPMRPDPAAPNEANSGKQTNEPILFTMSSTFRWDSEEVDSKQLEDLGPKLQELFASGLERVSVEGHTDSVGDPVYNMGLSQRRAKAVVEFLVSRYKIAADKIEAKGFGAEQPVADNGNYQGRRKNRRVEIKIWRRDSRDSRDATSPLTPESSEGAKH